MLSEAWMDQLEFQARWVAADLFPGQTVGFERLPVTERILLTNAKGTVRLAHAMLDGVYFHIGAKPSGLRQIATWDEIVSYCNSLVTEA